MSVGMMLVIGLIIPLVGTSLGAAMALFCKGEFHQPLKQALLGFASGVMIAASIWSLLIPAIELAEARNTAAWVPALIGFLAGISFLLLLDCVVPHLHPGVNMPKGKRGELAKSTMLILAVTLHNIPEGMAVGVLFAGALADSASVSIAGAFALAVGIAIQNFPEGAIISMPLIGSGLSKGKAFAYGVLSGVVEPIGALLTITMTSHVLPILPYVLSFAAGAMIYVVVEDLIPEAQSRGHSKAGTVGAALGFALMMVLDVALG